MCLISIELQTRGTSCDFEDYMYSRQSRDVVFIEKKRMVLQQIWASLILSKNNTHKGYIMILDL